VNQWMGFVTMVCLGSDRLWLEPDMLKVAGLSHVLYCQASQHQFGVEEKGGLKLGQ